jgi:threonine/homoserine/homoserine lactone efflux protein
VGLAAGVSPGPLLVLVITSTLRGGLRHGLAVAGRHRLSTKAYRRLVLAAGVALLVLAIIMVVEYGGRL